MSSRSARRTRSMLAFLAALVLVLAACGSESTGTEDTSGEHDHDEHDHESSFEVPAGAEAPTIEIAAHPDAVSGHNLIITTENYTVAPEHASTEPVAGEGHFHLLVDGEKKARFYNKALHLDPAKLGLDSGDHEITVELSANNHAAYSIDGEPIAATTSVTVQADAADGHSHHGEITEVTEAQAPIPTVSLTAEPDPKSGWNLHATIENFAFAPLAAGGEPVQGEGHLHLLVDGNKVDRMYGPWWYLPELTGGTHEISVELNANDHTALAVDGQPIRASVTIDAGEELAAADADVVIEATITGSEIDIAEDRVSVKKGQTVGIIITADTADDVHVHGYDLLIPVGPGQPAETTFIANSEGLFEVELEGTGRFLFELLIEG